MNERVTVRVLSGRSLTAADGRLIAEGEVVGLSHDEAAFAVAMGAVEIVEADATSKSGKRSKAE